MTVQIAFFAAARDIAGCERMQLDLDDAATINNVKHILSVRFPELEMIMSCSTWAIDHEYVDGETRLHHGAEIGLIPPVSGG